MKFLIENRRSSNVHLVFGSCESETAMSDFLTQGRKTNRLFGRTGENTRNNCPLGWRTPCRSVAQLCPQSGGTTKRSRAGIPSVRGREAASEPVVGVAQRQRKMRIAADSHSAELSLVARQKQATYSWKHLVSSRGVFPLPCELSAIRCDSNAERRTSVPNLELEYRRFPDEIARDDAGASGDSSRFVVRCSSPRPQSGRSPSFSSANS